MTHETIPIEAEDARTVHVLIGVVDSIKTDQSMADIIFDNFGLISNIPIFYHCEGKEERVIASKESGEERIPFIEGDNVLVVNYGEAKNPIATNMKVVGFEDGLPRYCNTETVWVKMEIGSTYRCFVWDAGKNEFAKINKNNNEPAFFPCNPDDISDWYAKQESVGAHLFDPGHGMFDGDFKYQHPCGRNEMVASCNSGDYGESGSDSNSIEELSNCGCDFMDTGECAVTWDLTMECHPTGGSWWIYAGAINRILKSHFLWKGFSWEKRSPKKLIFQNNKEGEDKIEDALTIEVQVNTSESFWDAAEFECGGASCDNWRLDSGIYNKIYKVNTPIASGINNILEINSARSVTWDYCNYLGARTNENYLLSARLNPRGAFSNKIIVQIYTVETRTVTRDSNCALEYYDGQCLGPGCEGPWGPCPWQNEVYATNGLNLSAQVGEFEDGAIGIDPTKLSRNTDFELAISTMYDELRDAENVPETDVALISLELLILRGAK